MDGKDWLVLLALIIAAIGNAGTWFATQISVRRKASKEYAEGLESRLEKIEDLNNECQEARIGDAKARGELIREHISELKKCQDDNAALATEYKRLEGSHADLRLLQEDNRKKIEKFQAFMKEREIREATKPGDGAF